MQPGTDDRNEQVTLYPPERMFGTDYELFMKVGISILHSSYRGWCWQAMPDWAREFWLKENNMTASDAPKLGTWFDFYETLRRESNGQVTTLRCENQWVTFRRHPDPEKQGYVFKYWDGTPGKMNYIGNIRTDLDAQGHARLYMYHRWRVQEWRTKGYGAVLAARKAEEKNSDDPQGELSAAG